MTTSAKVACPVCGQAVLRPFACKLCAVSGCLYCRPVCVFDHFERTYATVAPETTHAAARAPTARVAAGMPPATAVCAGVFPLP